MLMKGDFSMPGNKGRRPGPELPKLVLTGMIVGVLVIILISALSAALLTSGLIDEHGIPKLAMVSLILGSAAGAFYASGKRAEGYLITGLMIGGALALLRLMLTLSNPDPQDLGLFTALACILGGSLAGGIPRSRRRKTYR